jgi:hypothetical protein
MFFSIHVLFETYDSRRPQESWRQVAHMPTHTIKATLHQVIAKRRFWVLQKDILLALLNYGTNQCFIVINLSIGNGNHIVH